MSSFDLDGFVKKVDEATSNPSALAKLVKNAYSKIHSSKYVKYRPPGFYEIVDYDEIVVIGDLHGDLDALIEILEDTKLLEKITSTKTVALFLGDYIDRGDKQVETIASILSLKGEFPDNILLLRGNHEPPPLLYPYPHDFPYILTHRYGEAGSVLYDLFIKLFQKLSFAARIPGEVLFLHGGPTRRVLEARSFEEAFTIGYPCIDDSVLEEVLWSDPVNDITEPFAPSPRGAGVLYGEAITLKTLELARVKYIVRGHEAVNGFKLDHKRRVATIFSAKYVYGLSRASYMIVEKRKSTSNLTELVKLF